MLAWQFKEAFKVVAEWNKGCKEDRQAGYDYKMMVGILVNGHEYICTASDFLDYNDDWYGEGDPEEQCSLVGFNSGKEIMMVDYEDVTAIRVFHSDKDKEESK